MKQPVLFVDDERSILNSLVRLFRNEDYEIFTATSGAEALKIIEKNEIALVISDHRMPEMSGVEFLSHVVETSPDTIRIMLTGYADLKASIDAINKGEVYRFITKPWNDEELRLTVRQSLEYRNIKLENRKLTRTVKRQTQILKKLEEHHPGISDVSRSEDGSIVIDEDAWDDPTLDDILNKAGSET
ncbi:MAG: response regulator [bacterium]|nr:response regulator [bacterium]